MSGMDNSAVHIEVAGRDTLERAEKLLAGFPGGLEKAVRSAEERAASFLKANSSKAIRERYDIPAAAVKAAEDVSVYTYSFQGGISARVTFHGNKIPLYKYGSGHARLTPTAQSARAPVKIGSSWRMMQPGPPAFGHQLKSTAPTTFSSAFIARMKNGHVGFFCRTGGVTSEGHDMIKELMGSAVPQMLDSEEVKGPLTEAAINKFEERLDHEINAILYGWRL